MSTILERPPVYTNGVQATTPRSKRFTIAWALLFVAALGFVAAGSYTVVRGFDARAQVTAQLVEQKITTPEDASIPNQPVDDAATAMSQADIIQKHALEATGGKNYAEMDREDPLRQVAFSASALRTSLLSAVLAFNVANLAIGFGAFVAAVGLVALIVLVLINPKMKR